MLMVIFFFRGGQKRRLAQIFMSGHMAKSESFHFIHTKDLLIFSALLNMCIVKQNQPHKSQATRYSVQTWYFSFLRRRKKVDFVNMEQMRGKKNWNFFPDACKKAANVRTPPIQPMEKRMLKTFSWTADGNVKLLKIQIWRVESTGDKRQPYY